VESLGVAVGSVLAHALGASGRLVITAFCGGFLVGAAVLYWITSRLRRNGSSTLAWARVSE
jgi:hypothetical protein